MVRCADKATSEKVKSTMISTLIFFDGDGREYHRTPVTTTDSIEAAYKTALEKYSKKSVAWASGEPATVISDARSDAKKLVLLAFLDEKKDSEAVVNALEDRWNARHHERMVFTKVAFDRNSEVCRKYGVSNAPTLLLVNPAEEDAKKSVVESLVSKKELVSVHNFLVKAFDKVDRASKK